MPHIFQRVRVGKLKSPLMRLVICSHPSPKCFLRPFSATNSFNSAIFLKT